MELAFIDFSFLFISSSGWWVLRATSFSLPVYTRCLTTSSHSVATPSFQWPEPKITESFSSPLFLLCSLSPWICKHLASSYHHLSWSNAIGSELVSHFSISQQPVILLKSKSSHINILLKALQWLCILHRVIVETFNWLTGSSTVPFLFKVWDFISYYSLCILLLQPHVLSCCSLIPQAHACLEWGLESQYKKKGICWPICL